jgi:hypothetical protein
MLVSEFEGMEKYAKKYEESDDEEPEEGGEEEIEEMVKEEELPVIPQQDGIYLKYVIMNDNENHPVFEAEFNSLDPSRVFGSDAYIIRANKRDAKKELKMVQ